MRQPPYRSQPSASPYDEDYELPMTPGGIADLAKATLKDTVRSAVLGAVRTAIQNAVYEMIKRGKNEFTARRERVSRTTTVTIEPAIVSWLAFYMSREHNDRGAEHYRAQVMFSKQKSGLQLSNDQHLVISPAAGKAGYEFDYQGKSFTLQHHNQTKGSYYTLTVEDGSTSLIYKLLKEAYDSYADTDTSASATYVWNNWSGWRRIDARDVRPAGSVVINGETDARFRSDIEDFLGNREWYARVGQPYRRGYLFHGPPGTGKTSYVQMIAGEYGLDLYYLSLSGNGMNEEHLNEALGGMSSDAIILIEDIDTLFRNNDPSKVGAAGGRDMETDHLSFDNLINAIDGVVAGEGRILIMTANHPEVLPEALTRDGRTDVKLYFGEADADQARRLFHYFYPGHAELAALFGEAVAGQTPARFRQHMLHHKDDPGGALNAALAVSAGDGEAKAAPKRASYSNN